ncbi:NADH dehydrogenase [ubiquinone] 1 alpha subcomplex subunit 8-B-like [Iris pallida]|uniref:NADH dehydrogenase [ubiquinone] 1 alpha subcomplex subunit 8-B-like n=1 Tax=Iris pallida TaxID=29817 RepID=A0AAX6F2V7_IRIPA|nr:NADH dehydrogenase [ubiquinone] 1 alpha subcomplex subunit 8-B-like [Iris pallida]
MQGACTTTTMNFTCVVENKQRSREHARGPLNKSSFTSHDFMKH